MPVIMMSGHVTTNTAVEVAKIGALNFLEKPIALQRPLTTMEQGLSRSKEKPRSVTPTATPVVRPAGAMSNVAAAGTPVAFERTDTNGIPTRAVKSGGMQFSLDMPLREARDLSERAYSECHPQREGGSITRVVEKTGLERIHLYRKLKQLGIEFPRSKSEPTA